jgi:hypothetical protein
MIDFVFLSTSGGKALNNAQKAYMNEAPPGFCFMPIVSMMDEKSVVFIKVSCKHNGPTA